MNKKNIKKGPKKATNSVTKPWKQHCTRLAESKITQYIQFTLKKALLWTSKKTRVKT